MKKFFKFFGYFLVGIFLIIQFFRPQKNSNAVDATKQIASVYSVPNEVNAILKKACYDCHSNNTVYPWYSNIQPVAWWLNDHIEDGKKEINFDEFASYKLRRQYHKMEEVIEQVKTGKMPLNSYTWMHSEAKLTMGEKAAITGWAQSVMDSMQAKYPIDSLVRKKN